MEPCRTLQLMLRGVVFSMIIDRWAIKWVDPSPQRIQMDPHKPVTNLPGGLFPWTQANPLQSPPESAADQPRVRSGKLIGKLVSVNCVCRVVSVNLVLSNIVEYICFT